MPTSVKSSRKMKINFQKVFSLAAKWKRKKKSKTLTPTKSKKKKSQKSVKTKSAKARAVKNLSRKQTHQQAIKIQIKSLQKKHQPIRKSPKRANQRLNQKLALTIKAWKKPNWLKLRLMNQLRLVRKKGKQQQRVGRNRWWSRKVKNRNDWGNGLFSWVGELYNYLWGALFSSNRMAKKSSRGQKKQVTPPEIL